jgi:hypothetical protein
VAVAVGRRHSSGFLARSIARHPKLLGLPPLLRMAVDPLATEDPWEAVGRLQSIIPADQAYRVVLTPALASTSALTALLLADDGRLSPFAERAVRVSLHRNPFDLKAPILQIAAGGNREILRFVSEIAPTLNDTEARQLFAACAAEALLPADPYGPQATTWASQTVAVLMSLYPPLIDELLAVAGSDAVKGALASDTVVLAASLHGLVSYRELPRVAPLIADRLSDVPERFRPADNRYSTSDSEQLDTLRFLAWTERLSAVVRMVDPREATFRLRLAVLLIADAVGIYVLVSAMDGVSGFRVTLPLFGLSEGLTAIGILVALHVLSVELGAGSLPSGIGYAVAWPARLVSAYAVIAVAVAASLFPKLSVSLPVAGAVVLLIHVPFVARDLVSKSDARRAALRIWRDRRRDFAQAGRLSGRTYQTGTELAALLEAPNHLRRATTEPVTRHRLRVAADQNGYLLVDVDGIQETDALLARSDKSPLRSGSPAPALVIVSWPGKETVAGDTLAVLEVDEPEPARLLLAAVTRAFRAARLRTVDRGRAGANALAAILAAQVRDDPSGAMRTSRYLQRALTEFAAAGAAVVPVAAERKGYLQRMLPFDPTAEVVGRFEAAWRGTIAGPKTQDDDLLRQHALRLASTRITTAYASALDLLIARLGVVATDTPLTELHSTGALLSELGGLAAETAGHDSFFTARMALESMLDRLAQADPIPREERLVRQRFEELLGRALVADYFLETDVERGCRKLCDIAERASSPGRRQDILVGICKLGALAIDYGRVALAAKLVVMVVGAPVDWATVRAFVGDEAYGLRLSTLSQLAGEVFGTDVPASVSRFADWAEALSAAFPSAVTPTTRPPSP